ncbi:ribonuclease H-like domain-containing protein [Sparassis latifolia]
MTPPSTLPPLDSSIVSSNLPSLLIDSAAPEPKPVYAHYHWKKKSPDGRVVYIRDAKTADDEISRLPPGPYGFDLEWKPKFVKGGRENPVALVQLANSDTMLLIQVSAMSAFPQKLHEVLQSADYVKTGVGIQGDCRKLYADFAVTMRNCVDLSLLARSVDNPRWKGRYASPIGLSRLCETYEELTLSKGKARLSNWEVDLSQLQQDYAANDCHSAFVLYRKLVSMAMDMASPPLAVYYTFNVVQGRLCHPVTSLNWFPHNPEYDPGPPPPPKVKAEDAVLPKEKATSEPGVEVEYTSREIVVVPLAKNPTVSQHFKRRQRAQMSTDLSPVPPHQAEQVASFHSGSSQWPMPQQRRGAPVRSRQIHDAPPHKKPRP